LFPLRFSARLVFVAALLLVVPCLGQSASPDDASTEGNVYTNFFFHLRYSFSASWVAQSIDDETSRPGAQTRHLLTLVRNFPGQGPNGHSRATISLVAEDPASHPGISSGKEYVLQLAEDLKKDNYASLGDPQEVQLGGRSFFRLDLKGKTSSGSTAYQTVVFSLSKGYALGFILLAPNEKMLARMAGTLDKVEFF
jgi:hypothetical protein